MTIVEKIRASLKYDQASTSAKKWWRQFEKQEKNSKAIQKLGRELKLRNATLEEFFTAIVWSDTEDLQANLHFLDYRRCLEESEIDKVQIEKILGTSYCRYLNALDSNPKIAALRRKKSAALEKKVAEMKMVPGFSKELNLSEDLQYFNDLKRAMMNLGLH